MKPFHVLLNNSRRIEVVANKFFSALPSRPPKISKHLPYPKRARFHQDFNTAPHGGQQVREDLVQLRRLRGDTFQSRASRISNKVKSSQT